MMSDVEFSWPSSDEANYEADSVSLGSDELLLGVPKTVTKLILDFAFGSDLLPDNVVDAFDIDDLQPFLEELQGSATGLVSSNWQLMSLVSAMFILALLVPLVGIGWCCCRICSCCCGSKSRDDAKCSRHTNSLLFIILFVPASFGCLWYFLANTALLHALNDSSHVVEVVVDDTVLYVEQAEKQVSTLITTNIDELIDYANNTFDQAQTNLDAFVANLDEEYNLDKSVNLFVALANSANSYNDQQGTLQQLSTQRDRQAEDLEAKLTVLNSNTFSQIVEANDDICAQLEEASCKSCEVLKPETEQIEQLDLDLSTLMWPDLPEDTLDALSQVAEKLQSGYSGLTQVGSNVTTASLELINVLSELQDNLEADLADLRAQLNELKPNGSETAADMDEVLEQFTWIPWVAFFSLGLPVISVLLFFLLGCILGNLGGAGGGTRGCGRCCLIIGALLFFCIGTFFFIAVTGLFMSGGLADKLICETLQEPEDSQIASVFDSQISKALEELLQTNVSIGFEDLVEKCKNDETLFTIIELDQIVNLTDIENWQQTLNVNETTTEIREQIRQLINSVMEEIEDFEGNDDSIGDIIEPLSLLNVIVSSVNSDAQKMKDFVEKVDRTLDDLNCTETPELKDYIGRLLLVQSSGQDLSQTVSDISTRLNTIVEDLNSEADLTERIEKAIEDTNRLIAYLKSGEAEEEVMSMLNDAINETLGLGDAFRDHVFDKIETDLARCGPVYDVYHMSVAFLCNDLVGTFNMLWSGLGLALVIIFPLLITCVLNLECLFGRKGVEGDEPNVFPMRNFGHDVVVEQRVSYNDMKKRPPPYNEQWRD